MPVADTHRAYVFVDAAQLREGLKEIASDWRRINLWLVGSVITNRINQDDRWLQVSARPSRVFVYDAVGDIGDPDVEDWLRRNDAVPNVHVRRGALAGEGRRAGKSQKAVDVRLTVDALTWAANGAYDVAILVTGDGDFAPLAEALRDRGIYVTVAAFEDKLSELLATEADRVLSLHKDSSAWTGWQFAEETS